MNGRMIALGIVGMLLIGFGAFAVYSVFGPKTNAASMSIVFYDEDGNVAYSTTSDTGFFSFAFTTSSGEPVTKVQVTVSYTTAASGVITDRTVECELKTTVRLNTQTAGLVNEVSKTLTPMTDEAGSFPVVEYMLDNIITPIDSMGKTYGWSVGFKATINAEATIDGEYVVADPWSSSAYIAIKYAAAEFTVDGTIAGTSA